MTNIRVPRRLLERIEYLLDSYVTDIYPEEDELRALLNQPKEKSAATVKDSLTVGKAQMARDSAELRRLCAERDKLKAENERLASMLNQVVAEGILMADERDTLRTKLDEARELLALTQTEGDEDYWHAAQSRINCWLDANQPQQTNPA